MKKLLVIAVVMALAATTYGAAEAAKGGGDSPSALAKGTREIVVEGLIDPDSEYDHQYELSAAYGTFIQDNVEVGVFASWYDDDAATAYAAGVFGEYNFDLGTALVPFVGVGLGYINVDPDAGQDQDATLITGEAGVKYFISENVAVSLSGEYDWASEEVFPESKGAAGPNDYEDTNVQINLAMRFFIL